ncbi:MAG: hypothetical protein AAF330_07495, partial [Pseudomonadota bacterium]
STPDVGRILRVYVFGSGVTIGSILLAFLLLFVALVALVMLANAGADAWNFDPEDPTEVFAALFSLSGAVFLFVLFGFYAIMAALIDGLIAVLITQPVLAHYATTLAIENGSALTQVRQREGDHLADADGFADALDVGGGF